MSDPADKQHETAPEWPPPPSVPKDDPYPRMILVCFALFLLIGMVIFGVLVVDMTQRTQRRVGPPPPASQPAVEAPAAEGSGPG
ncbi:MAG: hypothetical protein KF886_12375 [Candidatus Hydrogenedentes bacterium]|nr:hypothetical protein [Candidatus Hydrogenedentota bacterium]